MGPGRDAGEAVLDLEQLRAGEEHEERDDHGEKLADDAEGSERL